MSAHQPGRRSPGWRAHVLRAFVAASLALASHSSFADRFHDVLGHRFEQSKAAKSPNPRPVAGDIVHRWNLIASAATGLDHTPVAPGETQVFGEQFGPGRASRAMAIIHLAIFDALNAAYHRYESYTSVKPAHNGYSTDAAVSQAAHDTLAALFPSQKPAFDQNLADELARVQRGPQKNVGVVSARRSPPPFWRRGRTTARRSPTRFTM